MLPIAKRDMTQAEYGGEFVWQKWGRIHPEADACRPAAAVSSPRILRRFPGRIASDNAFSSKEVAHAEDRTGPGAGPAAARSGGSGDGGHAPVERGVEHRA